MPSFVSVEERFLRSKSTTPSSASSMAQTWLCDTQTLCRFAEVLRFRQHDKIAQLIQIHRDPPIFQIILESANNMPSDFFIFSIPYAIDKIYQNI